MPLNESIVDDAALEWFGEQRRVAPSLIPAFYQWEKGKEREAIRRLNAAIPEEERELSVALAEKVVHNPERQTA